MPAGGKHIKRERLLYFLSAAMLGASSGLGQWATADQDTEASSIDWSRVSAYLSQVATDAAFDLPPLEEDLSFLRRCYVLATLCHMAYSYKESDVGSTSNIELPLAGALHDAVAVAACLVHFKEAALGEELNSPQQFGMWEVDGLGLVIAFRGTASPEDVFIDINITPVPLTSEEENSETGVIKVHKGFYEGAKGHADGIVQVVRQQDARVGRPLKVWVTGHSLGGAYANALILHLMERRQTAQLFAAGGGSVTFGAPMVVYSEDPAALYRQLAEFEEHAEAQYASAAHLQFHNFVNNADVVPRLLGRSLDTVHGAMEGYISSMRAVRGTARNYHPFGAYHFVIGASIRSLPLSSGTGSGRRMGDAAYGHSVHSQLDVRRVWKAVYATSGKGAGVTHHSIMSYQERLVQYMSTLARSPPIASLAAVTLRQEAASANLTSLFAPSSSVPVAQQAALDSLGRAIGTAGQAAAMELGASALSMVAQRWSSYRATASPPNAAGTAASSTSWLSRLSSSGATPPQDPGQQPTDSAGWFARVSSSNTVPVQPPEELMGDRPGFSERADARGAARESVADVAQQPTRMVTRSAARRGIADAASPQPELPAREVSSSVVSPEGAFGLQSAVDGRNPEPGSSGGDLGAERLQTQRSWFGGSRWVADRSAADESGALENLGAAVGSALWQYVNQRGGQGQMTPRDQPRPSGQGRQGGTGRERTDL